MIDDWEDLLGIPTEDNGDSTRRTIWGVGEVMAHPVHSFKGISVPEKSNSVVEVHPETQVFAAGLEQDFVVSGSEWYELGVPVAPTISRRFMFRAAVRSGSCVHLSAIIREMEEPPYLSHISRIKKRYQVPGPGFGRVSRAR